MMKQCNIQVRDLKNIVNPYTKVEVFAVWYTNGKKYVNYYVGLMKDIRKSYLDLYVDYMAVGASDNLKYHHCQDVLVVDAYDSTAWEEVNGNHRKR